MAFSQTKSTAKTSKPAKTKSAATGSSEQAKPHVALQGASLDELTKMYARFAPVEYSADISQLSAGDRKCVEKLIEAAKIIDTLQLRQRWSHNESLWSALQDAKTPLGKARRDYFWLNKGPWSIIDDNKPFLANGAAAGGIAIPAKKPEGANFYPYDATKEELETWMKSLPKAEREQAEWFFTTIRRDQSGNLKAVRYSDEYRRELTQLSALLKQAAADTDNASLKKFLSLRADAFLTNDYYESDLAWMDLDSPVDVTIGPYETYNDELFGYKAAFETYVNIRDQ